MSENLINKWKTQWSSEVIWLLMKCRCPPSWEPQEEGMISTAASLSSVWNQGLSNRLEKEPTSEGWCSLASRQWYVQNVSIFQNTFAIVSSLICVFWIQLTWTNAVFSRIALVSRFCAKIQLSVKIQEKLAKILFHQKTHGARRWDGGEAWGLHTHRGCGPALATPTCCEGSSAISSTSPPAYIYPLIWKYRGDGVFPR
jgi:hypothetical protein